jgi:hypothetical protein
VVGTWGVGDRDAEEEEKEECLAETAKGHIGFVPCPTLASSPLPTCAVRCALARLWVRDVLGKVPVDGKGLRECVRERQSLGLRVSHAG